MRLLPNLISAFRLALLAPLWALALTGHAFWVGIGLLVAGVSDVADGLLARRLGVTSARGAQLDSLSDQAVAVSGIIWLIMLAPAVVALYFQPLLFLLAVWLLFLLVGLLKFRRLANLHLWTGKAAAFLMYAFLVCALLLGEVPGPLFQAMFLVTLVSLVEGLAYQLVCPNPSEHDGTLLRGLKGWIGRLD
jgi:phosphatidylglycerophosphate synthase